MPRLHAALVALVATALACSNAKSEPQAPASTCGTHPPVVIAHASPTTVEPVIGVVQLSATSTDADDACLGVPELRTYVWRVDSRPPASSAVIPEPASPSATFRPDVPGDYQLEVVAIDEAGHESAPDFVNVTAGTCSVLAPTASLPAVVSAATFNAVTLPPPDVADANCVSTGVVTYRWTLLSRPAGSSAILSDLTAASPVLVPDAVGPYQLSVVVTSSAGIESAPAFVTVYASSCGTAIPVLPPLAASPSVPDAGQLVSLGLAGSIDDPNQTACGSGALPYRYRWVLLARPPGSGAALTSESDPGPSFVADVPSGVYQVALTVTDALGNESAPSFLSVTTSSCGANAPVVAFAQPELAGNGNSPIGIAVSATDADNACGGFSAAISRIDWTVVGQPVGAHPALATSSTAATVDPLQPSVYGSANSLVADAPGSYLVEAVATATNGLRSAPARATVTVSACGTSAPVVTQVGAVLTGDGSATSRPPVGTGVTLVATSFDADQVDGGTCGAAPETGGTAYAWTLVSAPAGSQVSAPPGPTGNAFAFTPDVAGTFVFGVSAIDAHGLASAPVEVVVPTGDCGPEIASVGTWPSAPVVGDTVSASVTPGADACVVGGLPPTVSWSIVSRPAASSAVLAGATTATPTFVPDAPGGYTLQVVVTDAGGYSTVQTKNVIVGGCTSAPVVSSAVPATDVYSALEPDGTVATPAGTIYRGDRVQLGLPAWAITPGTCGGATSTSYAYQWALVSRPQGSQAQLAFGDGPTPALVPDVAGGAYQVLVSVTDANGNASAPALFTLFASDCGARRPTADFAISNAAPNANTATSLTATTPADPEALGPACPARFQNASGQWSHAWTVARQPIGAHSALSAASGANVSFQADTAGEYVLQLVTASFDGTAGSVQKSVNVNQCGANPPVASAFRASQSVGGSIVTATGYLSGGAYVASTTLDTGFPVALSATVSDADAAPACGSMSQATTLGWSLVSAPATSTAQLVNAATSSPTFTPDVAGSYTVQLRSTDTLGYSSTTQFQLSTGICGVQRPLISALTATQGQSGITVTSAAGFQPTVDVSMPVQLSANVADADAACTPSIPRNETYRWYFTQLPPGSAAQLLGADTATPSFVPDVASGTPYVIALVVTDEQGHASAPVSISISAQCGAAAPVVVTTPNGVPILDVSQDVPGVSDGTTTATLSIRRSTDATSPFNDANAAVPLYQGYPVQVTAHVADSDAACGVSQTISYSWSIVGQPAGSTARLNNPGAFSPSFTPDVAGNYDLQLGLTDSSGRTSTTVFHMTSSAAPAIVVGGCGGYGPTAKIAVAGPFPAPAGLSAVSEPAKATVLLDASGSESLDVRPTSVGGCGLSRVYSYSWTMPTRPATSTASLDGTSLTNPTLTTDADGTYAVQVIVSDGTRSSTAELDLVTSMTAVGPLPAGTASFSATSNDPSSPGSSVVAWLDLDVGSGHSYVRAARCTANCNTPTPTWTSLGIVDDLGPTPFTWTTGNELRPLDVVVSASGTVYVAYGTGAGVTYTSMRSMPPCSTAVATNGGSGWVASTVGGVGSYCDAAGTSGSRSGRFVAAAIRSDGLVGVATTWQDATTSQVHYGECLGSSCTSTASGAIDTHGAGGVHWVGLGYDQSGGPRVAYDVTDAGYASVVRYGECWSGCTSSASWTFADVTTSIAGGNNGQYVTLRTSSGGPRLAFVDRGTTPGLRVGQCASGCTAPSSWSFSAVETGSGYTGAALAVDSAGGNPAVATRSGGDGRVHLWLASTAAGTWTRYSLAPATTYPPSVALPATGAVRVTAPSATAMQSIRFGQ